MPYIPGCQRYSPLTESAKSGLQHQWGRLMQGATLRMQRRHGNRKPMKPRQYFR